MSNLLRYLKEWYGGRYIRVDPEEPDTIGGMGVLHDMKMELSPSSKLVHVAVSFISKKWDRLLFILLGVLLKQRSS